MGCHLWQAQLALFLCIIHIIFASLSVMGALRFADVRYQTPQIARDDQAVSMNMFNMSFTLLLCFTYMRHVLILPLHY